MARTAGRKEIPAEATVADRTLEDQYGFIQRAAELMTDTSLYANLTSGNGQPVIAHLPGFTRTSAAHYVHVADVVAGSPRTFVIDHEGVKFLVLDGVFKGAFLIALYSAHLERV